MNRQRQYESVKLPKEKLTRFFTKKLFKKVFLSTNLGNGEIVLYKHVS